MDKTKGNMKLETEVGLGVTFTMTFPLRWDDI